MPPTILVIPSFAVFVALAIFIVWKVHRLNKRDAATDYPTYAPNLAGTMGVGSIAFGSGASGIGYGGGSCADGGGGGSCSF